MAQKFMFSQFFKLGHFLANLLIFVNNLSLSLKYRLKFFVIL